MSPRIQLMGATALFAVGAVVIALVLIATGSPPLPAVIAGVCFFVIAVVATAVRARSKSR